MSRIPTAPEPLTPEAYRHARLVRNFEAALAQLCANYRVRFVHEDGHGCAHLIRCEPGEAAGCSIEIADYLLDEAMKEHFR